jgi:hypothetical protein
MHIVKRLGLIKGQANAFLCDNGEVRLLQPGIDLTGQIPARGIWLNNRQRPFDGHEIAFLFPEISVLRFRLFDTYAPGRRHRKPAP